MPDIFNDKVENVVFGNKSVGRIVSLYKSGEQPTVETTLWEKSAYMYTDYVKDDYISINSVTVTGCGQLSKYQVGDVITDPSYPLNSGDQIRVIGDMINSNYNNLYANTYDMTYTCTYDISRNTEYGYYAWYNFPFPVITNIHNYVSSVTAKVTRMEAKSWSQGTDLVAVSDFHITLSSPTNWGNNVLTTVKSVKCLPAVNTSQIGINSRNLYYGCTQPLECYHKPYCITSGFNWMTPTGTIIECASSTYLICDSGYPFETSYRCWTPITHIFEHYLQPEDSFPNIYEIFELIYDAAGDGEIYGYCCQFDKPIEPSITHWWYICTGVRTELDTLIARGDSEEIQAYMISHCYMFATQTDGTSGVAFYPDAYATVSNLSLLPVVLSEADLSQTQSLNVFYVNQKAVLQLGFKQNNQYLPSGTEYTYTITSTFASHLANVGDSTTVTLTWNGL